MNKEKLCTIASALRSMAHPDRLGILMLLGEKGKLSVTQIQTHIGLTQPMASQHLSTMKRQSVINSVKDKNKVFYAIADKNVLKVISCMKKCSIKN